jgi:hypothetical protein
MVNPIDLKCPSCQVPPGERCTAPEIGGTQNSRKPVEWFHFSRIAVADEETRAQEQYPDN